MAQLNYMGPKTIFMMYGCLKPCDFYEFKVDHSLTFIIKEIMYCMLDGERAIDDGNQKKSFRNKSFVVWPNFIY